jgi:hypothetical protein
LTELPYIYLPLRPCHCRLVQHESVPKQTMTGIMVETLLPQMSTGLPPNITRPQTSTWILPPLPADQKEAVQDLAGD